MSFDEISYQASKTILNSWGYGKKKDSDFMVYRFEVSKMGFFNGTPLYTNQRVILLGNSVRLIRGSVELVNADGTRMIMYEL